MHSKEFIATSGGFSVKNGSSRFKVVNPDGTLDGPGVTHYSEISISSADITSTSAGKLGHASGVQLVPGQTGNIIELVSAVLIYDYAGAGYATGGDLTINQTGGSALTGAVTAANSLGAAADKVVVFEPLSSTATAYTKNLGLNLVASAAFTNGGSATGVVRVKVAYRVHEHGLG